MAGEGKEEVPVELREQPRRGEDNEAAVEAMRACYHADPCSAPGRGPVVCQPERERLPAAAAQHLHPAD